MHLYDDILERLDELAAQSPKALSSYLDELTGVTDAREQQHEGGIRNDSILVSWAGVNATDDPDRLSQLMYGADSIALRASACIQLPRLRDSQLQRPEAVSALEPAQRTLSAILVDHPVLLHPRIMFRTMHLKHCEFAPLAHLIAVTPRVEFPRLAHGVDPAKLTAFADHWCVRAGMQQKASKPQNRIRPLRHQGKTMLQAMLATHWPRVRMLASVFELDGLRNDGKRKASLLAPKGDKVNDFAKVLAMSVLAHCGIQPLIESNRQVDGFAAGLKLSRLADEEWFLPTLERELNRWLPNPDFATGVGFDGVDGIRQLAHLLVQVNPKHLPRSHAAVVMGRPAEMADVVQWLVTAILDVSAERTAAAGTSFKHFPRADSVTACRLLTMLSELTPESDQHGSLEDWFKHAMRGAPINREPIWEAAMQTVSMSRAISSARAAPVADSVPAHPIRARRAVV